MIVTTRLLTTGSVVSAVVSRKSHVVAFQREFKIVRTKEASSRRSSLKKLRKITSVHYSSSSASSNVSMPARDVCQISKEIKMEPPHGVCNMQNNLSSDTREILSHLRENLASLDTNMEYKWNKHSMSKKNYKSIRTWRQLGSGDEAANSETHFVVKILSYNILAQNLLESHMYLYTGHKKEYLGWERRMILLQQEILRAEANVICLQEMLDDHLEEFLVVFKKAGYRYLYKRRTNDKRDGLLLLYRADQLKLVDHAEVELYRPNIDILNRDNVAIVAKFSLIECPDTNVVVSTTHLLYNPKRQDVRLAQTQLLFAELERLAFVKLTKQGPLYHPIILSGDFNLQPHTGVYRFIMEGAFEFRGRGRNLEPALLCGLGNSLIPPSLLVTDNCQYYNLLIKRLRGEDDDTTLVKVDDEKDCSNARDKSNDETDNQDKVNTRTFKYQNVKIIEGQYAKFSSGSLTHPFSLSSLYRHANNDNEPEATTHQEKWVTVDYIFYSGVEPVSKYNLPTVSECKKLPRIPNSVVGSDHLCLGASFKLKKTKR